MVQLVYYSGPLVNYGGASYASYAGTYGYGGAYEIGRAHV